MSTIEMKRRLIEKIQNTDDACILEVAFRLLELESEDRKEYVLNDEQKSIVAEARVQIKNRQILSDDEANRDIDQWLSE